MIFNRWERITWEKTNEKSILFAAVVAFMATASVADAKACRDAKGHFMKCGTPGAK